MFFKTKEDLAKYAIEYYLTNGKEPEINRKDVNQKYRDFGACFVSVYIEGKLRGCIGSYIATEPFYQNIINNALNAAFSDYRFLQITKEELPKLKTEVSILTPISEFKPKDTGQLLKYLQENKPGLILERNGMKALFLPQVWRKLPEPASFLGHLCLKAGLASSDWQEKDTRYWIFNII